MASVVDQDKPWVMELLIIKRGQFYENGFGWCSSKRLVLIKEISILNFKCDEISHKA